MSVTKFGEHFLHHEFKKHKRKHPQLWLIHLYGHSTDVDTKNLIFTTGSDSYEINLPPGIIRSCLIYGGGAGHCYGHLNGVPFIQLLKPQVHYKTGDKISFTTTSEIIPQNIFIEIILAGDE